MTRTISAILITMLSLGRLAVAESPLLANGDFERVKPGDTAPEGWTAKSPGVTWETENGSRFLRVTSTAPGQNAGAYRSVPVRPDHKAYELTFRVRYDNVVAGEKSWYDARVILNFKDAQKKSVGSVTPQYFKGNSKGQWLPQSVKFAVPAGATTLEIQPTLFQAKSGTIDFDDFSLRPIDPALLPKKYDMSSPVVPPPAADKLPKPLHVDGNQLKDPEGKPVWLQGLSTDGLQWNPTGERTVPNIIVAIEQWKANCIRLAVSEELWFGKHEQQTDGGVRYRQIIDSAVNTAAARGVYIVIDLHRFRAPEQRHVDFWKEVATKYANHPAVIYELFNEPYGISWDVWRDGGQVTDKPKAKDGVAAESTEAMKSFTAIGMQALFDAVRATGAKNLVVIGGLDYSYDLSAILKGYAIQERGGHGIVYSTHVYPWKSKWQEKFLDVAAKYPLFLGEVGCPGSWKGYPYIPVKQQHEKLGPGATWPTDMIALIQKHKLNWTAFSFHPKCGPEVIKNWDYEPTEAWGVFVKEALAGKQFQSDALR